MKDNCRKGFTLAELMIVVSITIILASIGTIAIVQYQKNLKLAEMNNMAREIFVAAQNHLTDSKTTGSWQEYASTLNSGETASTDSSVSIDNADSAYQGAVTGTKYYYAIYSSDKSDVLTDSNYALSYMLPFGSLEDTVRTSGSYVIIFNPDNETIHTVYYTEKENFTSDEVFKLMSMDKGAWTVMTEKEIPVGVYGDADKGKFTATALKTPVITVHNEDTLNVDIQDLNTENTTLEFTVSGLTSKATAKFEVTQNNGTVTVLSKDNNSTWTYSSSSKTFNVVLDDIRTQNQNFITKFSKFYPGENISVTAKFKSRTTSSVSVSASSITNSLYASVTDENDAGTKVSATINNPRHLQNLDSSVSYVNASYKSNANGLTVDNAVIASDLDWADFISGNCVYRATGKAVDDVSSTHSSKFSSIVNDSLTSLTSDTEGTSRTLSNFNFGSNGDGAGLLGEINLTSAGFKISDINLENCRSYGTDSVGMLVGIVNNNNTSAYVQVSNVHAYMKATSTLSIADAYSEASDSDNRRIVDGGNKSTIGGLIGTVDGNLSMKNSSASVRVGDGKQIYAGGMIGRITSGTVSINESYVGGYLGKNGTKTSYDMDKPNVMASNGNTAAGGFIAQADNAAVTIKECYTTASVYGHTAGGFIGVDNTGVRYADVYTTSFVQGNTVGRFVGTGTGTLISYNTYAGVLETSQLYDMSGKTAAESVQPSYVTEFLSSELKNQSGSSTQTASVYSPSALKSAVYPYPSSASKGTHYGDWVEAADPIIPTDGIGFLYYEKVDGSYYYNGVQCSKNGKVTAVSNPTLLNNGGTYSHYTVEDDGYILVIPNGYLASNWNTRFSFNSYHGYDDTQWGGSSLDLLYRSGLVSYTSSTITSALGIGDGYTAVTINKNSRTLDYMNNDSQGGLSIYFRGNDDIQRNSIKGTFNYNYCFGNSIEGSTRDAVNTPYEIRSASQLKLFFNDNSADTFLNSNHKYTVTQTMDITAESNMSTLDELFGTYQGIMMDDGNYSKLSDFDSTFVGYVGPTGIIQNIVFDGTYIDSKYDLYRYNGGYGTFVSSLEGKLQNVTVNNTSVKAGSWNYSSYNFGVIGSMSGGSTSAVSNVKISNVDFTGTSFYANSLGVIASAGAGSITDTSITGVSIKCPTLAAKNTGVIAAATGGFVSCKNLTISDVNCVDSKVTSDYTFGAIGSVSGGSLDTVSISKVNINDSTITSDYVGAVANLEYGSGTVSGLSVSNINVTDSTINSTVTGIGIGGIENQTIYNTSVSDIKISKVTNKSSSSAGIIGEIDNDGYLNNTVIRNISILDSSITAQYTGAIGNVASSGAGVYNTLISGVTIGTDPADDEDEVNAKLDATYAGIAVGFNKGVISGITVGTHEAGITVNKVNIDADNFGIIACNSNNNGYIVDYIDSDSNGVSDGQSTFEHISLTNLTLKNTSGYNVLNAGIIANNSGIITDFAMKDIAMTGWNLPTDITSINAGAIGNNSGTIDRTSEFETNPVRNLTMSGFTSGTDKTAYTDYAFAGLNSGYSTLLRYITINDYYTEGYGAVYNNADGATISNITIDMTDHTDDIPYVIDPADPNATENRVIPHIGRDGFAYKNSSRVSTCTIANAVKDTVNPENSNILGNVFIEAANNTGTIDDDCEVTDSNGTVLWPVTSRMSVAPAAVTQQPSTPSASAQSSASASASSSADSTASASASPSPSPSPSVSSAAGSSASPSASAGQ